MAENIPQRPTVDPQTGNILVHGRGGVSLPLAFKDAAGDPRNVAGLPIYFEVQGKLRVALGAGSSNDERVILLGEAEIDKIFGGTYDYCIRDESGAVPDVPWSGRIETYGFKEEPPAP